MKALLFTASKSEVKEVSQEIWNEVGEPAGPHSIVIVRGVFRVAHFFADELSV